MKNVISHLFSFIKQLFLRLRLVVTLSIGRDKENEENELSRNTRNPTERSQYDSESNSVSENDD